MNELPKILIVDDNRADCETIMDAVSQKAPDKYEIEMANSAEEAMAKLGQKRYSVVLLDIILFGMDGLELLGKIKTQFPQTEEMIITGNSSLKSAIKALNLGAFAYLLKPINIEELIFRIEKALEKLQADFLLKQKIEELKEYHKRTVDRELGMIELENEIKELTEQIERRSTGR